jgi:hypothetical protein
VYDLKLCSVGVLAVKAEGCTLVCFSLTDACVPFMRQIFALRAIRFILYRVETQKEEKWMGCNKMEDGGWRWMEKAAS